MNLLDSINEENITMVAHGDSLTFGWMVPRGYFVIFEEMISQKYDHMKFNMVKSGIPGDTAQSGLYRLEVDVFSHEPHIVLIQFALNDAFTGVPLEVFKKNLERMVKRIEEETFAKPVLLTSTCILNYDEYSYARNYYQVIEQCSLELDVPLVQIHRYWERVIREQDVKLTSLLQSDGVHPNLRGHELMAEALMEVF